MAAEVLLRAQDEAPDGGAALVVHRLDEQAVRARRPLPRLVGDQEVRPVVVDGVDLADVDELLDVDRACSLGRDGVELLVGEDHLPAVELVAVADLLVRNLLALLRAHAADLESGVGLVVELVEVDVEVLHGGDERDRHVDQAEGQRAAPQRSQRFFTAFTLASRAASRSSVGSGGGGGLELRLSPFALASMSSRTRSR